MTRFNHRHSVQRLLIATALPLGLLAGGATPANAGVVNVTGPNGAWDSYGPGGAGGAATADAGHLIPNSDPSNTATATGGKGGAGGAALWPLAALAARPRPRRRRTSRKSPPARCQPRLSRLEEPGAKAD